MPTEFFTGTKEIVKRQREDISDDKFSYVSVSQFWKLQYSDTFYCGMKKTYGYTKKIGISKQISNSTEMEVGASLSGLSAKINQKKGSNLTISLEETSNFEATVEAPKCGLYQIAIYQLVSKWQIENYVKKGFFRRKEVPTKTIEFEVNETELMSPVNVLDVVPKCGYGCQPQKHYSGSATMEFENGLVNLPYNPGEEKDMINVYGMEH
jgi:hypothetical protein